MIPDLRSIDPAEWPRESARMLVVAHDVGGTTDHHTLIGAGEWVLAGIPCIGVFHVRQFPLTTTAPEVISDLVQMMRELPSYRDRVAIVDARSNSAHFANVGATGVPCIGVSVSGADAHALRPETRPGQGLVWGLSKQTLFDELAAEVDAGTISITGTGDAPQLLAEMQSLQRIVTQARNVRYEPPAGGHDDLANALAYAVWGIRHLARVPSLLGKGSAQRRGPLAPEPSVSAWT